MFTKKFLRDRFMVAAGVAMLATATLNPTARAAEFSQAELFIELNDTDGDLGIHASIDGGPYSVLTIEDPLERKILWITAQGRLAKQGLTQLDFESAEPPFEELPPAKFFERFPEGTYEIEARRGRVELEAEAVLSHVLAAPADGITLNGVPAAENCDALPLPTVGKPVTISWDPVTASHPDLGIPGPIEIVRYQLFVQQGNVKFSVDLPPTVTSFEVPSEISAPGGKFKFEIVARTSALNNTAVENCFVVE